MSISIQYDGNDVWSDGESQPVPFVSMNTEYVLAGERLCRVEVWTMSGNLVGCEMSDLISVRNSLLNSFKKAFATFSITGITGGPNAAIAEVREISIDESDYIGYLPYTISLAVHVVDNTRGITQKILDPSDVTTYKENPDGTVDITRKISARGVRTTGNESAVNEAISFISARASSTVYPMVLKNSAGSSLKSYLVSSEESVDRIACSASLTITRKADLLSATGDVINRYRKTYDKKRGEPGTISHDGEITSGRGNIEKSRAAYKTFRGTINAAYLISEEITEDEYTGKVTYKFSMYDPAQAGNFPQVQDDLVITVKQGAGSVLTTTSVQGSVSAAYGCIENRENLVKAALLGLLASGNLSLARELTTSFLSRCAPASSKQINPEPISKSMEFTAKSSEGSYRAEFDNRIEIPALGKGEISVSTDISFPIDKYIIKEHHSGGKYICQNLGYVSLGAQGVKISMTGRKNLKGESMCETYAKNVMGLARAGERFYRAPSYTAGDDSESYSLQMSYRGAAY